MTITRTSPFYSLEAMLETETISYEDADLVRCRRIAERFGFIFDLLSGNANDNWNIENDVLSGNGFSCFGDLIETVSLDDALVSWAQAAIIKTTSMHGNRVAAGDTFSISTHDFTVSLADFRTATGKNVNVLNEQDRKVCRYTYMHVGDLTAMEAWLDRIHAKHFPHLKNPPSSIWPEFVFKLIVPETFSILLADDHAYASINRAMLEGPTRCEGRWMVDRTGKSVIFNFESIEDAVHLKLTT